MANDAWKKQGKVIKGILDKISKNPGKFGAPFVTQDEEFEFFSQNAVLMGKELKTKFVIQKEADATDPKKSQALPGKPAILIK
jgi:hypothetical protein